MKLAGNFEPAVRAGNLLYVSGHISGIGDDPVIGKVGLETTLERGYEGARRVGDALIAALEAELGTLDSVTRIVKVTGFVNAAPGFVEIPAVMNGVSDRLVEVFGPRGRHSRSAIGVASLPANSSVEAELIAEIADAVV